MVAGTPALSQVDTAAWRRAYGVFASGEAACSAVNTAARARLHTRVTVWRGKRSALCSPPNSRPPGPVLGVSLDEWDGGPERHWC